MSRKSSGKSDGAERLQQISEVLTLVFRLLHGNEPPEKKAGRWWLCYRLLHMPDAVPPTGLSREEVESADDQAQQTRQMGMALIEGSLPFERFLEESRAGDDPERLEMVHRLARLLRRLTPDVTLPTLPPLPQTREPLVPARPVTIPLRLHLQINPDRLPDSRRLHDEIRELLESTAGEALHQALQENAYIGSMLAPRPDAITMWLPRADEEILEADDQKQEPVRATARRAIQRTLRKNYFQRNARYDLDWVSNANGRGGYWIARVPDENDPERTRHYRVFAERIPGKRRKRVVVERLL